MPRDNAQNFPSTLRYNCCGPFFFFFFAKIVWLVHFVLLKKLPKKKKPFSPRGMFVSCIFHWKVFQFSMDFIFYRLMQTILHEKRQFFKRFYVNPWKRLSHLRVKERWKNFISLYHICVVINLRKIGSLDFFSLTGVPLIKNTFLA